jgi:hypothetical protein
MQTENKNNMEKEETSNSSREHKGTLECLTEIAASVLSMLLVLLG